MLANVRAAVDDARKVLPESVTSVGAQTQLNYEGDHTDIDYHGNISRDADEFLERRRCSTSIIRAPWTSVRTRGGPTVQHYGYELFGRELQLRQQHQPIVYGMNYNLSTPVDNPKEAGRRTIRT